MTDMTHAVENDAATLAHRWGGVLLTACGAAPPCRIAPTESKVTCRECLSLLSNPADWAERDQFAAALREAARTRCTAFPLDNVCQASNPCPIHGCDDSDDGNTAQGCFCDPERVIPPGDATPDA